MLHQSKENDVKDAKGQELKVGDVVILPAMIEKISENGYVTIVTILKTNDDYRFATHANVKPDQIIRLAR